MQILSKVYSNHVRKNIANIITFSRILFSVLLLFLSPVSYFFAILYILCGVTDVLDGYIARKLHIESAYGVMLDSVSDLIFIVVYIVKILPLFLLPSWIIIWIVIIGAVKTIVIVLSSLKKRKLYIKHSFANKLAGFLIFILPLFINVFDIKCITIVVCIVATISIISDV